MYNIHFDYRIRSFPKPESTDNNGRLDAQFRICLKHNVS